jgi:hypothetical protein
VILVVDRDVVQTSHLRTGDDTACGIVEVLPDPPAAVRVAVGLKEAFEFLCDLDQVRRLPSVDAAVRFTILHKSPFTDLSKDC